MAVVLVIIGLLAGFGIVARIDQDESQNEDLIMKPIIGYVLAIAIILIIALIIASWGFTFYT